VQKIWVLRFPETSEVANSIFHPVDPGVVAVCGSDSCDDFGAAESDQLATAAIRGARALRERCFGMGERFDLDSHDLRRRRNDEGQFCLRK